MPKITFINPNLVVQSNDLFTTGIVYMPVGLSYFVGECRLKGFDVSVVDAFGEKPNQWFSSESLIYRGLTPEETYRRISPDTDVCVLYAINLTYHNSLMGIVKEIKRQNPSLPIVVMENSQAVTAYSLNEIKEELGKGGVDYIITGDAEHRGVELLKSLVGEKDATQMKKIDGIGYKEGKDFIYNPKNGYVENLESLAMPAWDLFPLKKYWGLRYSHGPFSSKKYLPIITSRGCPYPCGFCVIPETNNRKWRGRSAKNVVDEMEYGKTKFGVTEFHLEDVNPTVNEERTKSLCHEIINRGLNIQWKICSGTKVETIKSSETIKLMAEAGCRYISISPESGSEKVMKLINKPFNLNHAIGLVKDMNKAGIRSQACFVLGYPGEEQEDRQKSLTMLKELTKKGIDEVAIFLVTPVPGSSIYKSLKGYKSYSELTFSPTWREDYRMLNKFRIKMYRTFLWTKFWRHPKKFLKQPFSFLSRRFQTKMEMVPYRALHTLLMKWGILGTNINYKI